MKKNHTCPKCGGTDVLEVQPLCRDGRDNQAIYASVAANPVMVTRFVCCACGYVEQWVDPEQFACDAKPYLEKKRQKEQEMQDLDDYWRQKLKEKKEKEAQVQRNREPWEK